LGVISGRGPVKAFMKESWTSSVNSHLLESTNPGSLYEPGGVLSIRSDRSGGSGGSGGSGPVTSHLEREKQQREKRRRVIMTYISFCVGFGTFAYVFTAMQKKREEIWRGHDGDPPWEWEWARLWQNYRGCMVCLSVSVLVLFGVMIVGCCKGDYAVTITEKRGSQSRTRRRMKCSRVAGVCTNLVVFISLIAVFPVLLMINPDKPQTWGTVASGVFTVLACILGFREIYRHWMSYRKPRLQRHVVRILAMVPIYAVDAFGVLMTCQSTSVPMDKLCSIGPADGGAIAANGTGVGSGSYGGLDGWVLSGTGDAGRPTDGGGVDGGETKCGHADQQHSSCYESGPLVMWLSILRELYEAYTLYSFFMYLTVQLIEVAAQRRREREVDDAFDRDISAMDTSADTDIEAQLLRGELRGSQTTQPDPGLETHDDGSAEAEEGRQSGGAGRHDSRRRERGGRALALATQEEAALLGRTLPGLESEPPGQSPRLGSDEEAEIEQALGSQPLRTSELRRLKDAKRREQVMAQVGLEKAEIEEMNRLLESLEQPEHSWKFCMGWMKPWPLQDGIWLGYCRVGVLQYVLVELLSTIVVAVSRHQTAVAATETEHGEDYYGEMDGFGKWDRAYTYVVIMVSLSQCWALYCLVHFYEVTKELLDPIKPLSKFFSIKIIVFFTFWQSFAVNLLDHFNAFDPLCLECKFGLPAQNFSAGVQACLICFEMFVAASLHQYIFSYKDYREPNNSKANEPMAFWAAVRDTLNNRDVHHSIWATIRAAPSCCAACLGCGRRHDRQLSELRTQLRQRDEDEAIWS
jgi:hypothetical protein